MGKSNKPTDAQLIAAIEDGDQRAFETLYFRYRDWVLRLAWRFTGNQADALDVMQETFSYLLRKFPGFSLSASMTTFLYPVVRNLSIAARRKTRRGGGDDALQSLSAPTPESSFAGELPAALAALDEAHREVLVMRYVDEMSLSEIAAALAIPLGTAKSRLHYALSALREDPRMREYFDARILACVNTSMKNNPMQFSHG